MPIFCEVHNADCRAAICGNNWYHAFDLIFADPPFNIGHEYDEYFDILSQEEYFDFTSQWVDSCIWALREGGVFAINVPDDVVPLILEVTSDLIRIEWVIWHYRFGQCTDYKFINSHTHCLIFRKGDVKHTWNPDAILVESDRRSKYGDNRIADSARNGMRVPLDVWSIENDGVGWGRVTHGPDRMPNHPNQLPFNYLDRLVKAYTNEGDIVFDPFGGTGTTAAAALHNQRNAVTAEISPQYTQDIVDRCKAYSPEVTKL